MIKPEQRRSEERYLWLLGNLWTNIEEYEHTRRMLDTYMKKASSIVLYKTF